MMGKIIKRAFAFILISMMPTFAIAQNASYTFKVYINDIPYSGESVEIPAPCYPVMASFFHSHYDVTRIRMEYPIDPSKFFMFPAFGRTHMEFHEEVLKNGQRPYMDWVAEDDNGKQYGRIRMLINAPDRPLDNDCETAFTDS